MKQNFNHYDYLDNLSDKAAYKNACEENLCEINELMDDIDLIHYLDSITVDECIENILCY